METWSIGALARYGQVEIPDLRKEGHQNQLARIAVLLLVSSLCCPLHAQNSDFISSDTTNITTDTKVVIGAPVAVFTSSMDVFSIGIPIHPVYIQAPSGLVVWLSIQCKGGAARLSLPDYVYNFSSTQTDRGGAWNTAAGSQNSTDGTWLVTGLGIKFNQNISVSNDVLATLAYTKDPDNDIAGKATMTITLSWTVTIPDKPEAFRLERSKSIIIVSPTYLTSISTFRATVAALCLVGIFVLCCLGCLNTVAVSSLRRFSVYLARENRDEQECEQNRVFNPLWMPCAPTEPDFYSIESSPNPLMLMQRRKELKTKILRMSTPFSLMDRMMRARHVKSSSYARVACRFPCAPADPPLRDSSSDDESSATRMAAACCLSPSGKAAANLNRCCNSLQMEEHHERSSIMPSDSQLVGSLPHGSSPQQGGSPVPTPAQATWRQPQTRNFQKVPAEPGVYLRSQHDHQDGAPPGNRGRNEITVGYALMHHRLAPSHGVLEAEDQTPNPTVASCGATVVREKIM